MTRLVLSVLLVVSNLLVAFNAHADASPNSESILAKFKQMTNAPGVALTVMRNGSLVLDRALGVADLEQGVAMTGDTVLRIGSISKTMTAVVAVRLSTESLLDLDRPVGDYLDGFTGPAKVATARQLASHLSGVRGYRDDEYISHKHYASTLEALERFENDPLVTPPGEKFLYTSAGYTLLSAILAKVQNRNFETVMNNQLWLPLEMKSTGLDDIRRIIPQRARYYVENEAGELENGPAVDNSFKWAGGGMGSTTHELAAYGSALLGHMFLTEQEKSVLFNPMKTNDGALTAYGLGWYVDMEKFIRDREQKLPPELFNHLMAQVSGRKLIWHSGTAVGSVAMLMMEPSQGLVLALAANKGDIEKEVYVTALDLMTTLAESD